jgi:putative ABC transport system ATP-binding protein
MIKIKDISKKFVSGKSENFALIGINLEIKEGEFVAITGPSGSGKSTLLNIIGGLDNPSKGSIFVNNKDISLYKDRELSEYRNKNVGIIFQEFYLEESLSVKENILLPTYFNNDTKDPKLADKLIHEVDLSAKINSSVNELSGGQKQRVAIARALINNPTIILADEPTGNLDSKTGEKIITLLKRLHKDHKVTLIVATHDDNIAKSANRIIKIEDGKLCS